MDADLQNPSSGLLFGGAVDSVFEMGPTADETGMWLGGDGEEGFLGSLESGGALMNSGGWSISTSPGEEGLRWSGVKMEMFDEWAGQTAGGKQMNSLKPPSLRTTKAKPAPTGFLGVVKPDPEDAWTEFVSSVMGGAPSRPGMPSSSAPVPASASNSPPSFPPPDVQLPPLTPTASKQNISAAGSTTALPGPSPPAQQRISPRVAANTAAAVVHTSAPTSAVAKSDVKAKVEEEEGDDEDEDEDVKNIEGDDGGDELDPGSELTDKRRRNREHAKRSRLRKRVRLGGLEEMVLGLRRQNVRLRQLVKQGIPDRADDIIRTCAQDNTNPDIVAKQDVVQGMRPSMSVGASSSSTWSPRIGASGGGSRSRSKPEMETRHHGGGGGHSSKNHRVPSALKLMSPCYQSVKALADSQANFILTNPNLPDCPIIFASQGFLDLTGYEGRQVIGKNCRFLQGPGTDPVTLSIIRNNLAGGRDTSVCIQNYKADGTPFWNQLSIGILLDAHGQVANHVGVLCEVNEMPPALFHRLLHRVPLPESLLNDEASDSGEDSAELKPTVGSGQGGVRLASPTSTSAVSSPRVVDRLRRTRAAAAAIGGVSSQQSSGVVIVLE